MITIKIANKYFIFFLKETSGLKLISFLGLNKVKSLGNYLYVDI